jgi:hypothetical protein
MKQLGWVLVLSLAASPAWAAKKITVQELKEILVSLQQARKGDDEVSTQLKQVELGEELTRSAMKSLAAYIPGPLSTEQMYILEGKTSILPPPATDLPATPAPAVEAQKAILANAVNYVTRVYMQNPHLTATATTSRFQDGVEGIRTNSGMTNNMPNAELSWAPPNKFMRLLGSHAAQVESEKGIEIASVARVKTPWGQNGQVSESGPGPILSVILQEAAAGGKLKWLRWETVNGKPAAVFSFAIPKQQSHYRVDYCCFPITEDSGRMGYEGVEPNFQTGTSWKAFRTVVGYHGEFFIDPETGTIVRVVTQAELKPTDFVHQEDMRIDYGPVVVEGKRYVLPVDSFTLIEVVPNGDNYAARYSIRHTLFAVTYQNYQLPGAAAAQKRQ